MQKAPLVDIRAVLRNEDFALARILVLKGNLDLVVGLLVDGARIGVLADSVGVDKQIQLHALNVLQRQLADFIVKHIELSFRPQCFIKRILGDVKERGVVLRPRGDNVPRVLKRSHAEAEVLGYHLDNVARFLVRVDIGVLILEVAELVVGGNLDNVRRAA